MSLNLGLWTLSLLLVGVPTLVLMLDRVKDFPTPRLLKVLGVPAAIVFALTVVYLRASVNPLLDLIIWGAIGGLAGTVTLDAVRLVGVKINAFPVDMPQMFGAMALGVAPKLPKHVMARMVAMLADLPEANRKEMMEPRIRAIAGLDAIQRRLFLQMMLDGLNSLPQEKRDRVMKTQIEILSSLPEDLRMGMVKTMDESLVGPQSDPDSTLTSPMPVFRNGSMPRIPMTMFRNLAGKWGVHTNESAFQLASKEAGVSPRNLDVAGYSWHAINGATYGIAYTLLFGSGSWLLAFGWGTFVWFVMMASMPRMMPMIHLPYPKFMVVPLLAHWAMAIPIGYFALNYVPAGASAASLLGTLLNR